MDPIEGLRYGIQVALTPENVLAAIAGAFLGTAVGCLPGLSPPVVLAILLVPTAEMRADTALIMMGAIYYGTQYGDSLSAILMGVPSEPASVVIGIDGFQITKKGRPGSALSIAAVGAFIGASIGLLFLLLLAIPAARWALAFAPPEFFVLTLAGFLFLSRLSSAPFLKSLVALAIGLALMTIGLDPFEGHPRFTFGQVSLLSGIGLVPGVMGLVGLAEILFIAANPMSLPRAPSIPFRQLWPSRLEWSKAIPASLRGAVVGFAAGLVPGPTTTISTFVSYRIEKHLAPDEVGHGAVQAVAGPKSADDSSISGHLVPLLSLGLPFTATAAIMYASMLLHGITPGPLLIADHPELFWGLVAAMYIGNVALLIMNFPLVALWTSILRVPQRLLTPALVLLILIGAYALRNSIVDVGVVIFTGVLGFFMRQGNYDRVLVILAMALGELLETSLGQSLQMGQNDLTIFVARPIPAVAWSVVLVAYAGPAVYRRIVRRPAAVAAHRAVL